MDCSCCDQAKAGSSDFSLGQSRTLATLEQLQGLLMRKQCLGLNCSLLLWEKAPLLYCPSHPRDFCQWNDLSSSLPDDNDGEAGVFPSLANFVSPFLVFICNERH